MSARRGGRRSRLRGIPALLGITVAVGACDSGASPVLDPTVPDVPADPAQAVVSRHLDVSLSVPDDYTSVAWPVHWTENVRAQDNTPDENPVTDRGATLGRVLFYDTELSFNRTVSCASCHEQALGFTDDEARSLGAEGGRTGAHSMRLANANFYFGRDVFWDRRTANLEEQILLPVLDAIEMGFTAERGGPEALLARLRGIEYYPILFEWAFDSPEITRDRIERAVAQFIRSMVSVDSEFDRAFAAARADLGPDLPITELPDLSPEENLGFQLFVRPVFEGGAGCSVCHLPPTFVLDSNSGNNGLDPDEVRVFKSPSLRNVAVTGPYMHDGRFATLDAVLDHYSDGIVSNPAVDRRLLNDGPTGAGARLTPLQRRALVAFLGTLTDTGFLSDPRFSDPFHR